jgi:linoleoyl-CoA desaturase
MKPPGINFNVQDQPEFFTELRKKVNRYFKDNNLSRHANFDMKIKTVFMVSLYFVPLALLLTGLISSFWIANLMWALMGLGMAGIGMTVTHDAMHRSYSKNQKVNNVLGFLINFNGGYHVNWKIQHNVLHHSFTNIEGFDEDFDNGWMRFSPNQRRRWIYRFQVIYAPFFYGLMSIHWLISKDFESLKRYRKKELLAGQGLTFKRALIQVIFNKSWYLALTLILPMIFMDMVWWQVLLGFLLMHFVCGLVLAFIFQAAHVLEETDFYVADNNGSVENSFAIHQLKTTANFARRSRIFSWFIGGLNFQIEHHLFPNICHVHYKQISKIVKETAEEFSLPYLQHKTFFSALKSHFSLLYRLGTGKYDRMMANT